MSVFKGTAGTAGPELDRSVLVNIKEQRSGVDIVHKYFPWGVGGGGGSDSILSVFSWEPSQAIIVLGALVI